MMGLLVYKEKLKNFYAEHEFYVNPIIKFISAFIALTLIKKNVGYNDLLTMWPVIMGISVIMAFMPWTIIITALTAIIYIINRTWGISGNYFANNVTFVF